MCNCTEWVTVAVIGLLVVLGTCGHTASQSLTTLDCQCISEGKGRSLFFAIDAGGDRLLVSRGVESGDEELVEVPTKGGTPRVWYQGKGRNIFERFDFSRDGRTVVFAKVSGSGVFVLRNPQEQPVEIANVHPDVDVRQVRLSCDGQYVGFTAGRVVWKEGCGQPEYYLYVAAVDGSGVNRISSTPSATPYIPYAINDTGTLIAWIEDPEQGPMQSDLRGRNSERMPWPSGNIIRNVFWRAGTEELLCESQGEHSVKLMATARNWSAPTELFQAPRGHFLVARGAYAVALLEPAQSPTATGTVWLLKSGQDRKKMFQICASQYEGCSAWSHDGRVLVLRNLSTKDDCTVVWKSST